MCLVKLLEAMYNEAEEVCIKDSDIVSRIAGICYAGGEKEDDTTERKQGVYGICLCTDGGHHRLYLPQCP